MKIKKIIAAVCAAGVALCFAGCGKQQEIVSSTVSESVPQSSVQEESSLPVQTESSQPAQDNNTSEVNNDSEYRMPKDHVRRIVKVLERPESEHIDSSTMQFDIEQYNVKSVLNLDEYAVRENGDIIRQLKLVFNISTNITLQEKAVAVLYYNAYLYLIAEEHINNKDYENIVMIANDNIGNLFLVSLAYEKDGGVEYDKVSLDADVLKAIDEVKKWELQEEPTISVISPSSGTTSQPTTSEPTSTPSIVNPNLLRPEVKEALDSYEALMNEYFDFMKKYNNATDKSSMIMGYLEVLQKYSDAMDKLNAIDDLELTTAENAYYLEVTTRVLARMSESY